MMVDYVGIALPLLGILCGLITLVLGKHQERIKELERQILG